MGEIWPRYGRDMGEIWARYTHRARHLELGALDERLVRVRDRVRVRVRV